MICKYFLLSVGCLFTISMDIGREGPSRVDCTHLSFYKAELLGVGQVMAQMPQTLSCSYQDLVNSLE